MKIALLGTGKTGSKVFDIAKDVIGFNSKNKPDRKKLQECDVLISFLAGDVFQDYIPLLIESEIPVITGSTGFEWPSDIDKILLDKKLTWIRSHNFSLGMNVVRLMIEKMSLLNQLFDDGTFSIHDIHHTHKKDSPSGTALSWKHWLGEDCAITAQRTGDVVGYHHLHFESSTENVKLIHEAKDRAIFAKGAYFAAKLAHENKIPNGLNDFNTIIKDFLKI